MEDTRWERPGSWGVRQQVVEALGLQTASRQIKVRWDRKGQSTAQGQSHAQADKAKLLAASIHGLLDRSKRLRSSRKQNQFGNLFVNIS